MMSTGHSLAAEPVARVITVRLSRRLHELLKREAHAKQVSLNWLCVSKLLCPFEAEILEADRPRAMAALESHVMLLTGLRPPAADAALAEEDLA